MIKLRQTSRPCAAMYKRIVESRRWTQVRNQRTAANQRAMVARRRNQEILEMQLEVSFLRIRNRCPLYQIRQISSRLDVAIHILQNLGLIWASVQVAGMSKNSFIVYTSGGTRGRNWGDAAEAEPSQFWNCGQATWGWSKMGGGPESQGLSKMGEAERVGP